MGSLIDGTAYAKTTHEETRMLYHGVREIPLWAIRVVIGRQSDAEGIMYQFSIQ